MAIQTLTPAVTKVATEYNYLNSLALEEGLHKPIVDSQVVQRYGRQDITGLIEKLGAKKQVHNLQFSHYEKGRIHGVFRASASAATAAAGTGSGQIEVAAAYNETYTGQSPYATGDSFTTYMPRVFDLIEFNGWQAYVTAVNGISADFIPVDSAIAKPAILTTDDVIVLSNAHPEASSAPESRNSGLLSYTNYIQTFRGTHKITNTEADIQTWVEVEGKDGEKGYFYYLEGIKDEYLRYMNETEAQLIAGRKINNLAGLAAAGTLSIGDANSVVTTEGMIPQISGNGNVEAYSSGAFALADVKSMVKNLQKYRGSNKNLFATSHNLRTDIDDMFLATGTNLDQGSLVFNQFDGSGDQKVKFEFDSFSYGGFNFAMQTLDIFSDPNFLGYSGGIYKDLGMVIPMDNTVTYNSMNSSTTETVPSMRINYLGANGDYQEWTEGFNGRGVATSGDDFYRVHFMCKKGIELFALNRFVLAIGS